MSWIVDAAGSPDVTQRRPGRECHAARPRLRRKAMHGNLPALVATNIVSPFTEPASPQRLQSVARALEANGFATRVVSTAEDAKHAVLDLVPLGSEVHIGASVTLESLGLHAEFESG